MNSTSLDTDLAERWRPHCSPKPAPCLAILSSSIPSYHRCYQRSRSDKFLEGAIRARPPLPSPAQPMLCDSPLRLPIRLWCRPVWSVFLSVPHARRVGIYEGLGTPRPCCAVALLLATAARGIGFDGGPVGCHPSSRAVDPGSKWGAPSRRGSARIPRRAGGEERSRCAIACGDVQGGPSLGVVTWESDP